MKLPEGYFYRMTDMDKKQWIFRDDKEPAKSYRIPMYSVQTRPFGIYEIAKVEDIKKVASGKF